MAFFSNFPVGEVIGRDCFVITEHLTVRRAITMVVLDLEWMRFVDGRRILLTVRYNEAAFWRRDRDGIVVTAGTGARLHIRVESSP